MGRSPLSRSVERKKCSHAKRRRKQQRKRNDEKAAKYPKIFDLFVNYNRTLPRCRPAIVRSSCGSCRMAHYVLLEVISTGRQSERELLEREASSLPGHNVMRNERRQKQPSESLDVCVVRSIKSSVRSTPAPEGSNAVISFPSQLRVPLRKGEGKISTNGFLSHQIRFSRL